MHVEQIIGDLLLRTNCVVIPSFGGFVARAVPTRIDYTKGIIYPPTKAVTFNRSLQNNDGLLVSEYARIQHLSYSDAEKSVVQFVRNAHSRMALGERLTFDKVGYLYTDEHGAIRFEQDRFFNLLMESYGLTSVQFIPSVSLDKPQEIRAARALNPSADHTQKEPIAPIIKFSKKPTSWKSIGKYVAAAAILPVLFYGFWIPITTDVLQSRVLLSQDFNPLKQSAASIYSKTTTPLHLEADHILMDEWDLEKQIAELPEGVNTYSYRLNEDTYIPVKLAKTSDSDNPENNSVVTPISTVGNVHLIAGCFSNKENALRLIAELNTFGYSAYIVDFHNGLHRVAASNGSSSQAVFNVRETLKNEGFSTWILKK